MPEETKHGGTVLEEVRAGGERLSPLAALGWIAEEKGGVSYILERE